MGNMGTWVDIYPSAGLVSVRQNEVYGLRREPRKASFRRGFALM